MTFDVRPRISSPRLDLKPNIAEKLLDFELVDCVLGTVLTLTELTPPSLNLQVGTGELRIKGYYIKITAAETLAMSINETAKVYVQLTRDGNSEVTGAQLGKTTGSLPSDSMQIAEVVTDGTNITTITSKQVLKERDDVIILVEGSAPAAPEINTVAKVSMQAGDSNNKKIIVQALRNGAIGDVYVWRDPGTGITYAVGDIIRVGSGDTKPTNANVPTGALLIERDTGKLFVNTGSVWQGSAVSAQDIVVAAGDVLIQRADTEEQVTNTSYTKIKEMSIGPAGTYRVKFDLKVNTGAGNVFGQIFKNGVAVGTERSTASTTYSTFSEDLTFAQGDLIQLYARAGSGSVDLKVRNFRVYGSGSPQVIVLDD